MSIHEVGGQHTTVLKYILHEVYTELQFTLSSSSLY